MSKDHDDLVSELLGLGSAGLPDCGDEYILQPIESFAPEPVVWLWEPYIRRKQLTLLDARAGSGKTSLICFLAAAGSNGISPFNGSGETFRTMYFGNEDGPGDLVTVFLELGGKNGAFFPFVVTEDNEDLQLDEAGLAKLERLIVRNNIDLVVFDPMLEFLPSDIKKSFDDIAIRRVLTRLRRVADRTNTAIVMIRQFAATATGKDFTQYGTGGEIWRNSARGQLVMIPHPDRNEHESIVKPGKGSLRAAAGPAFGVKWSGDIFGLIAPEHFDEEPYADVLQGRFTKGDSTGKNPRGAPKKLGKVCLVIQELLEPGAMYVTKLLELTKEKAGCEKSTFYLAKKSMNLRDTKGMISLPDDYDPFDDKPAPWAGLDD